MRAVIEFAIPIAEAKRKAFGDDKTRDDAEVYPSSKVQQYGDLYAHHFTDEGIEFVGCELCSRSHGDSHHRKRTLVTWSEMEFSESKIKEYEAIYAKRQRDQLENANKWKREQFERLKKELGE
jgi:5-methylthioribose kinase